VSEVSDVNHLMMIIASINDHRRTVMGRLNVDLNDVRNEYFVVTSMKDLFENVASQNIVDFIKETHFYKQL